MTLESGERQVAPVLSGIRRDHVARYEWAARVLPYGSRVLDIACGVGYGARILAEAGHHVMAVDISVEAIAYGKTHYAHDRIRWCVSSAEYLDKSTLDFIDTGALDAVVSFETIEHLKNPEPFLRKMRSLAPRLLASVPNEECFPYTGQRFHFRHYTREEFASLLRSAGYTIEQTLGQTGLISEVEQGMNGRTFIVDARHDDLPAPTFAPEHVAIVALGPSAKQFYELAKNLGGAHAYCDEVWGINNMGDTLRCDRVFHMDDVWVQERRAAAKPDGPIANMLKWLRTHPGPVYTSTVRPGYPGLVAFPLEDVLNANTIAYFNNTVAYAIAFARFIGVKKLSLFGVDFTYANQHHGERGRACCEFHLALCMADGIEIVNCSESPLMDACAPGEERLYGYDGVNVAVKKDSGDGRIALSITPRELPTAEEIEKRYDHSQHTNRLVAKEKSQ